MHRVEPLPGAITRFYDIGGCVEFAIFDDADGDPDAIFAAICEAAPIEDAEALRAIGFRKISDDRFFGDWYDPATQRLLLRGTFTFETGETLTDAPLAEVAGKKILNGGAPLPEVGEGGQFAYAFSSTPYGLRAEKSEVQQLFDKIRHIILPQRMPHEILDWSSADLVKASSYFAAGAEWWGVFLFSIYLPEYHRLIILHASTTD